MSIKKNIIEKGDEPMVLLVRRFRKEKELSIRLKKKSKRILKINIFLVKSKFRKWIVELKF